MKFRKKPVVIDAEQWTGSEVSLHRVQQLGPGIVKGTSPSGGPVLLIDTLEGTMTAYRGYWIIRGVQGEVYACKPDIFEATYEPVATRSGFTAA